MTLQVVVSNKLPIKYFKSWAFGKIVETEYLNTCAFKPKYSYFTTSLKVAVEWFLFLLYILKFPVHFLARRLAIL
jgi:hypothetical protein